LLPLPRGKIRHPSPWAVVINAPRAASVSGSAIQAGGAAAAAMAAVMDRCSTGDTSPQGRVAASPITAATDCAIVPMGVYFHPADKATLQCTTGVLSILKGKANSPLHPAIFR
jgi:hypothetical protein